MKKILVCTLTAAACVLLLAGCFRNGNNSSSGSSLSSAPSSSAPSSSGPSVGESHDDVITINDAKLREAFDAVKSAYGESYLVGPVDKQLVSTMYGVNMDDVEEMFAQGPRLDSDMDLFIGVKAKNGKAEEVKKSLDALKTKRTEDIRDDVLNLNKAKAAEVVAHDNYVFYIALGDFTNVMDRPESEQLSHAQSQVKIGVDAINQVFEK